jgi:hypothetical protein
MCRGEREVSQSGPDQVHTKSVCPYTPGLSALISPSRALQSSSAVHPTHCRVWECVIRRALWSWALIVPLALGSHLFAILDQLAIERLPVDLQEVGRLGFLPLSPLQSEEDIFTFEVRQGAPAHQGRL